MTITQSGLWTSVVLPEVQNPTQAADRLGSPPTHPTHITLHNLFSFSNLLSSDQVKIWRIIAEAVIAVAIAARRIVVRLRCTGEHHRHVVAPRSGGRAGRPRGRRHVVSARRRL